MIVIATEYVVWAEQEFNEIRHEPYDNETAWLEWASSFYSAAVALGDAAMESALAHQRRRMARRGEPRP